MNLWSVCDDAYVPFCLCENMLTYQQKAFILPKGDERRNDYD